MMLLYFAFTFIVFLFLFVGMIRVERAKRKEKLDPKYYEKREQQIKKWDRKLTIFENAIGLICILIVVIYFYNS